MHSRVFLFLLFSTCAALLKFSTVRGAEEKEPIDGNEMGMSVLFEMVNTFLGDIVHKESIGDSFINLTTVFVDGELDQTTVEDWKEWAKYLIGFAVCLAIGILFIIVMPIAGFCFCCCRLCGKCGGRKRVHESKRSKCKRRTYCTFLVVFNTLALAGVVCAFICNSLISKRLENENGKGALGHVNSSLTALTNFIDAAVVDVDGAITTTINSTTKAVLNNIESASLTAVDAVLNSLNATASITEAKTISEDVNRTKDNLDTISTLLQELSDGSQVLSDNLTSVKDVVDTVCTYASQCPGYKPDEYKTEADFSRLDDLSKQTQNVSKALDMEKFIKQAENEIELAKQRVKNTVNDTAADVNKAVADLEKKVQDGINDLVSQKNQALDFLPQAYRDLTSVNNDVKEYRPYVFYAGIGICSVYLLIVVLYYTGILFGLSGERPGEDAPCCNTGVGARFLMAGVAFTFIFAWLLMLICSIMFVVGGPLYTEACRYFDNHDPAKFQPYDVVLNNGLDIANSIFKNKSFEFSLSASLKKCQDNEAIYSALDLNQIVDLKEITDLSSLDQELARLKRVTFDIKNIDIISPDLTKRLTDFADSGLDSVNFTDYYSELNKKITTRNLTDLAEILDAVASSKSGNDKTKLETEATRLRALDRDVVNLNKKVQELNNTLVEVQRTSQFKDAILHLVDGLKTAQVKWQNESDTLVRNQIDKLATDILDNVTTSVDGLISKIQTDVARCEPLTSALYRMSDSVCILILDPINGMWFSFGWCLFFFILCLIFAILLTGEYRCEHKYEKEFDDPSYTMYGGGNQDTIPLTRWPNCNPMLLKYLNRQETTEVKLEPSQNDEWSGDAPTAYIRTRNGSTSMRSPPPY